MKFFVYFIFIEILFSACKQSNVSPYKFQGVLTGYNERYCPEIFCGGMYVTITNDTAKNPPLFYLVNKTLSQLGINEATPFPINVLLDFKRDTGYAGQYNFIIISKIKVVN